MEETSDRKRNPQPGTEAPHIKKQRNEATVDSVNVSSPSSHVVAQPSELGKYGT